MPRSPECRRREAFVRDAVTLEGLFLAVFDDRNTEHRGVFERASHQQRGGHRPSIVGDRHTAGAFQLGDVGQLLALLAARHRADGIDPRQVRLGRFLEDEFGDAGVVVHRVRVRHARDRGESASDRRRGSSRDRLLVLLTRLAQVDVDVDQARADDQTGRNLDDGHIAVDGKISAHTRDAIAVDQDVEHAVPPVCGIDDAPAFQKSSDSHQTPSPQPSPQPSALSSALSPLP